MGRAAQPGRVRVFLQDLLMAIVLGAIAVAVPLSTDELAGTGTEPDGPIGWLLIVGAAWALPFRRLLPVTALVVGAILQVVVWSLGYPDTFVSTSVLLYSAAANGNPRLRPAVWTVAVLLTAYTGLGVTVAGVPVYAIPVVGLFSAVAVVFGGSIATRQAATEAAVTRAEHLERSRRADRDRALAEERSRIARELHDVVAHGLSVIVVQAAAAQRILDRDPAGAATALQQIERTGRDALGEMRHVLAAIRTEPEDSWQPSRGLADLDALVAELDGTGLPVTVVRTTAVEAADGDDRPDRSHPQQHAAAGDEAGRPAPRPDLPPVPATVDLTAYRIVQEALTNVLKHGGAGATAQVRIDRRPQSLAIKVVDDGRGARARDGGGHGLQGMAERVEVFGGSFRAGPKLGGGFTVEATLPWAVDAGASAR